MLKVSGVEKSYKIGGLFSSKKQKVLHDVNFECGSGECLGIIGESGSGKSTLGRLILGIEKPDRGSVFLEGNNIFDPKVRLGNISAVFQNYTSSINPYFTVEKAILELLTAQRRLQTNDHDKVDLLLKQVGLDSSFRKKYVHELSGGEAQRVCIARAVATEPKCIVLDEAISSLDVSVQMQVLKLLMDLKQVYKLSYIFITHDIQAAAYICDRLMIFRSGQIEEVVLVEQLKHTKSPYTRRLLECSLTI